MRILYKNLPGVPLAKYANDPFATAAPFVDSVVSATGKPDDQLCSPRRNTVADAEFPRHGLTDLIEVSHGNLCDASGIVVALRPGYLLDCTLESVGQGTEWAPVDLGEPCPLVCCFAVGVLALSVGRCHVSSMLPLNPFVKRLREESPTDLSRSRTLAQVLDHASSRSVLTVSSSSGVTSESFTVRS